MPILWLGKVYDRINGFSVQDGKCVYPFGHAQWGHVTFLTYIFRSNHRDDIMIRRTPNSSFYHFLKFHFGSETHI